MIYVTARLDILGMLSHLNRKDRAKPPARRGCTPTPRRAIPQIFNRQYSIFNSGLFGLDITLGYNAVSKV
jgi:hypothetical protein